MSNTQTRSNDVIRQILVLLATIATIVFNGLSQTLPIGGQTSAQVSNHYSTFFTPANYAFSIWGVIYMLLMAYSIYQVLPAQRHNENARKIGWLYIGTSILNCLWITLFQYNQLVLSVVVMVALIASLITIYVRLNNGHTKPSTGDRWLIFVPFSVYLGWISVATIANVAALGVSLNWGDLFGIPAPTWAAIMLVVATVVGVIMAVTRRDVGYVAVFVWAFTAIINKQAATPIVPTTAFVTVIILLIALVVGFASGRGSRQNLSMGHA